MEFAFDARTEQLRAALVDFTHTQVYPADGRRLEVATCYAARATNADHWLTSMNRLQQRIGAAAVQDRGEDPS
jgi:hypothetical protein